jgi:hypothetical protein
MKHAMSLDELGLKHGTDKASNGHDYLRLYENYLDPIRDEIHNLLEIGIAGGNSIRMWEEYLSPMADIYGVDHTKAYVEAVKETEFITPLFGDASFPEFWQQFRNGWPDMDVIIDDGAHTTDSVWMALQNGFKCLRPGGLWFIEDTHASYLPEYRRDNSGNPAGIELGDLNVNELIADLSQLRLHELGANQSGKWKGWKPGDFSPNVQPFEFVHYYKSLIVIKKRLT